MIRPCPMGLTVQLWPERPADPSAFEVAEDRGLSEPDATPAVASVLTFAAPLSDEVVGAAGRADRERIALAMAGHPGGVRLIMLWQPEQRRQVVITLATSLESLEEGGRRIGALALLPGEDVTLLPGPDHVDVPGGAVNASGRRGGPGTPLVGDLTVKGVCAPARLEDVEVNRAGGGMMMLSG